MWCATLHVRAAGGDEVLAAARVRRVPGGSPTKGSSHAATSTPWLMSPRSALGRRVRRHSASAAPMLPCSTASSWVSPVLGNEHNTDVPGRRAGVCAVHRPACVGVGLGCARRQAALGDLRANDFRHACLCHGGQCMRHHVLRRRRLHCDRRARHIVRRRPTRVEARPTP